MQNQFIKSQNIDTNTRMWRTNMFNQMFYVKVPNIDLYCGCENDFCSICLSDFESIGSWRRPYVCWQLHCTVLPLVCDSQRSLHCYNIQSALMIWLPVLSDVRNQFCPKLLTWFKVLYVLMVVGNFATYCMVTSLQKLCHMVTSPHFHTWKIYIAYAKTRLEILCCHRKFYRAFPVKFMKVTSSRGNFTTFRDGRDTQFLS